MSSPTREQAYTALFGLLSPLQGVSFNTVSRKLRFLDDLMSPEFPALTVAVGSQKVMPRAGVPSKRTYSARVFIYVEAADATVPSGIQLNNLIDVVDEALAPNPFTSVQTLGGAVAHAWIEGTIEIFEAIKTQRAAAVIPVTMLLP